MKNDRRKLMMTQIYVNDIVFGGMSDKMFEHFFHQMQYEFEMSVVGELVYFIGLKVQKMEGIVFISMQRV